MTSSGGGILPPPLGISDSKKGLGMEGLMCVGITYKVQSVKGALNRDFLFKI